MLETELGAQISVLLLFFFSSSSSPRSGPWGGDLKWDLWGRCGVLLLRFSSLLFFFFSSPRSGPWGVGVARGTGPHSDRWGDPEKSPPSAREDCECFVNAFVIAFVSAL